MVGKNSYLSVVSPVYQSGGIVDELVKRITEEVLKITQDYEIILVDDGSLDHSWEKIEENCKRNKLVKGIKLTRNFGQHYAITAGLNESCGKYIVVMDCDMQANPKYIKELLKKAKNGYDVVFTIYDKKEHGFIKNIFSKFFHRLFNWLGGNDNLQGGSQYGSISLLSSRVVKAYSEFNDYHRHYFTVIRWLGFPKTEITIQQEKRYTGESSYSTKKLIGLAMDGIISQTDNLLRFSIYTGFIFAIIGFIAIIYIIAIYFYQGLQSGWGSTIVLIIFSTGLILMSLGVVGIYLGKIFEQTKERPFYIIDKRIN